MHLDSPSTPPRAAQATALAGLRVYLDSLGCAKNLVDSEATLGLLAASGCEPTTDPETADLLVVNTCGFLEAAREESVERILELAQLKGTGRARLLAVLGCLVARAPEELAESLPEVDLWLPAGRHGDLAGDLVAHLGATPSAAARRATDRSGSRRAPVTAFAGFGARQLLTPAHTAYLKIAEGCSNTCSFCSIPLMRGTQRSRPVDAVLEEARWLAAGGVRELHLVAQDLTHYGFDLPGRPDLLDLATALSGVQGIEWIRLLYAHPAHLTRRLRQGLFAVPKVVRYLDLPVQHASDRILRRMNRPYTAARVREHVRWLREHVPGITLRSTVIVGFPGETEAEFTALCRFVDEMRFERLGVFTYSREPGTPSFDLAGRPRRSTALRRLHRLVEIQMQVAATAAAAQVGARQRLLVDARLDGPDPEGAPLAAGALALGRGEGEALDIDGSVFLEAGDVPPERIVPGAFVEALVTAADVYDRRARALWVEPGTRCESVD